MTEASDSADRPAPLTALVIEDVPAAGRMVARILQAEGIVVTVVESAEDALRATEAENFDLAICDINLPDVSGLDLIEALRSGRRKTAVLMISGETDPAVADRASERGAYGYLTKPFDREQLVIAARAALSRRAGSLEDRRERDRLEEAVRVRTAELEDALSRVERSHQEIIRRLAWAVEMRDAETGGHIDRIGKGAGLLATAIGIERERAELVGLAAPMHDVGKVGIIDAILLKPAALTRRERRAMERHTEIGHRLLDGSDSALLELAATIALTHHERVNGEGYPRGLARERIPLEGRVVAIVDVFDALTSNRPYRQAMALEEAVGLMVKGRGTHFDEEMLDLFVDRIDSFLSIARTIPGSGDLAI